jgi:hypothetical protein
MVLPVVLSENRVLRRRFGLRGHDITERQQRNKSEIHNQPGE